MYHVDPSSAEPVGGIARFQTLVNHYRRDDRFKDQPNLITLFSGDAFNPSLESTVTKGSHMVAVLNNIGADVACVGNHDLDFGVDQFQALAGQCNFPWLLANVLDPALGEDVPLGNAKKTVMLTSSNGLKIGVMGLVEQEWLATLNSMPPDLIFKSASLTATELAVQLRNDGADVVIAVTHQREPNDNRLAQEVATGTLDIILGGHDHFYGHAVINGCHVLRSGTDFKQLSYVELRKSTDAKTWDLHVVRRDVLHTTPEDQHTAEMAAHLTSALKEKLGKPIGYTLSPLDARFCTVRSKESNLGNFVCDLMRTHYDGDCCIMASGTIRGDQIYPPGIIRLRDIMDCFPFEDPCVVIRVSGQALLDALENSVSTYPALEGRFPQVSNVRFTFDPSLPPRKRITGTVLIAGEPLVLDKQYRLVTRGYMARGKDGFDSLLVKSGGGLAEEIVSEETGTLISMMLRQYFISLKILGRWGKWSRSMDEHWQHIHQSLHEVQPVVAPASNTPAADSKSVRVGTLPDVRKPKPTQAVESKQTSDRDAEKFVDDSDDEEYTLSESAPPEAVDDTARRMRVVRQIVNKWRRIAGVPPPRLADSLDEGEYQVKWTHAIAPRVEGRIRMVTTA